MNSPVSDPTTGETSAFSGDGDLEQPKPRAILGDTKPVDPEDTGTNLGATAILIAFFAWLWFIPGPVYFLAVLALVFMIFLHELGHFMTAKWTGMKPTEFFIGFGPRIFSFQRGEVTFGVKAIWAGAYVRIIGMNNLDPVAPEDEERAYMNKSYPRRLLVITAGSIMHMLQAIVLFVLIFSVIGVTRNLPGYDESQFDDTLWTAETIVEDSPAEAAGLLAGDKIETFDGQALGWVDLVSAIRESPGETVELAVSRPSLVNGVEVRDTLELPITIGENGEGEGRIGLGADFSAQRQTPGVVAGLEAFGTQFKDTLAAIPQFLSPSTFAQLGGLVLDPPTGEDALTSEERPISVVGAVGIAGEGSSFDWAFPLYLWAVVNVFVGIFNMLPFLPLDGGHALIATYERIRSFGGARHQVDVARWIPITYVVLGVLGFIGLTTIFLDIVALAT